RRRADLDFWRAHLKDAPVHLELPFSLRRPELPSFEGAAVERSLDRTAGARLDRFAQSGGLTPAVVFLTAFAATLRAWSGDPAVQSGVPGLLQRPDPGGSATCLRRIPGTHSPASRLLVALRPRTLPVASRRGRLPAAAPLRVAPFPARGHGRTAAPVCPPRRA